MPPTRRCKFFRVTDNHECSHPDLYGDDCVEISYEECPHFEQKEAGQIDAHQYKGYYFVTNYPQARLRVVDENLNQINYAPPAKIVNYYCSTLNHYPKKKLDKMFRHVFLSPEQYTKYGAELRKRFKCTRMIIKAHTGYWRTTHI